MARKRKGDKIPNSNNSPLVGKDMNKSLTPIVCPTRPTLIDHNVDVVSGEGGVDDMLGSIKGNALLGEMAYYLKQASTGNKANTDNNATTFDEHLPGN